MLLVTLGSADVDAADTYRYLQDSFFARTC